jgi:hypothetical protein
MIRALALWVLAALLVADLLERFDAPPPQLIARGNVIEASQPRATAPRTVAPADFPLCVTVRPPPLLQGRRPALAPRSETV